MGRVGSNRKRFAIDGLERRMMLAGQVVINEIMASNVTGIVDDDSAHSDWIELKNTGASAVSLSGWALTDDSTNMDKWVFPGVGQHSRGGISESLRVGEESNHRTQFPHQFPALLVR